jgi:hypothetical protein
MQLSIARRRTKVPVAGKWALAISGCCLLLAPGSQAAALVDEPPFSLDQVAGNLQQLADDVPDEEWPDRIIPPSDCNCGEQDDANAEEASADIHDEDFQVAPLPEGQIVPEDKEEQDNLKVQSFDLSVALVQRSSSDKKRAVHNRSITQSGCPCSHNKRLQLVSQVAALAKKTKVSKSKALSMAASAATVSSGTDEKFDAEAQPTGIWLHTCKYSQPDLVFWRLTNTAYLRGGIVLKETFAYTDSCKMCDYNNVACNKDEVELTDGNCLCMWRMNGAEMQTMLMSCSACVTDCIGVFKTFDLGKPDPGMQKGMCLRKKPHKALEDLMPVGGVPA